MMTNKKTSCQKTLCLMIKLKVVNKTMKTNNKKLNWVFKKKEVTNF